MSRIQKNARQWLAPAASRMLHTLALPRTAVRGGGISLQKRHAQPQHGFHRSFAPAILGRTCSTSGEATHNMSACTMLSESEKDLRDSVEVFAREVSFALGMESSLLAAIGVKRAQALGRG